MGPPGWSYNDALVALIAPILVRTQDADLSTRATRQVVDPLGIKQIEWRRDREGNPLAPADLALCARDLQKLGALVIGNGTWRATPLLPPSWVKESLSPKGAATWRAGPVEVVGYGLLWFTGRLQGQRVAWA
jgi:CubicO group peptidase (beta-lactamase class C family)